jgi:hypothetical protein
VVDRPNCGL